MYRRLVLEIPIPEPSSDADVAQLTADIREVVATTGVPMEQMMFYQIERP